MAITCREGQAVTQEFSHCSGKDWTGRRRRQVNGITQSKEASKSLPPGISLGYSIQNTAGPISTSQQSLHCCPGMLQGMADKPDIQLGPYCSLAPLQLGTSVLHHDCGRKGRNRERVPGSSWISKRKA